MAGTMTDSYIFRSFLTKRPRSARLLKCVVFLCLTAMIAYNSVTSEVFLNQLDERVHKNQLEKARCCLSSHVKQDMCGNSDCQWPCESKGPNQLDIAQDGEKAFFHETSGRSSLDFRQACSVESFAHLNPNITVYVLMTGHIDEEATTFKTLTENYSKVS